MKAKRLAKLKTRRPIKKATELTKRAKQLRPASRAKRPPAAWRKDYPIIQELRTITDAPVDSVGCERLADPSAPREDFEWQCLVAAMLSSQTKDQQNAEAMAELRRHGNTVEIIANTPVKKIDKLIAKVGFHAVKAANIKAAAKICRDKNGGRVPTTLEGLLALPGVGPKMAHLTMLAAFNDQKGLCVDTHVHRIANALGWISTKTPEDTRKALELWLPQEHWPHLNVMLVGLGQQQQQQQHLVVERCIASSSPVAALRLVSKIGLVLRSGKFACLDEAAKTSVAIRRILH
jgi:endonuclease-3